MNAREQTQLRAEVLAQLRQLRQLRRRLVIYRHGHLTPAAVRGLLDETDAMLQRSEQLQEDAP